MCKERPCWGTPDEIEKIIEAGYADKLMEDYWAGSPDIYLAAPAIRRYEGRRAPFMPIGECAFLENDLCILHDAGLKPLEGRAAPCGSNEDAPHEGTKIRAYIVREWKKKRGKTLLARWREIVKKDDANDDNPSDFLKGFMNLLMRSSK